MSWKLIIKDKYLFERITYKIDEISNSLKKYINKAESVALFEGKMSVVLFFAYYSLLKKDEKYIKQAMDIIYNVFEKINEGFNDHTFCNGLAGITWCIKHLANNDFIVQNNKDFLNEIDTFFYNSMMYEINDNNWDYIHGAVGIGVYFLSRPQNNDSKTYIEELVNKLEEISIKEDDGSIKWLSVVDVEKKEKVFDFGLAHGIPSIIVFLSRVYESGICKEKCLRLLDGAIKYILKNKMDISLFISIFRSCIRDKEKDTIVNSRLGWCYGDLGIGIALYQAAKSTGNKSLEEEALNIFIHSVKRKDFEENSINDACFCHGTAGIAHIYNRMYHYTGIENFKNSAVFWIQETLKMAKFDDGPAGYKIFTKTEYKNEYGLVEGIAGIGLVLLSAISEIEPKWDRCFLLS